jgi:hypothetical protein
MKEPENLKGAQSPLASNDWLGRAGVEPRNVIFCLAQKPRKLRAATFVDIQRSAARGAS